MNYKKPQLPYNENDLSPAISQQTVSFHYGKHLQSYIDNLERLIKDTKYDRMNLEEVVKQSSGRVYDNASQAWNHIFYFFSFSPDGGGEPKGQLRIAIERDFGSFDNFKTAFVDAGVAIFGSGWIWLSRDDLGKLFITQGSNAHNPMSDGLTPLLAFDVWEHAYYLDYQNRRRDALLALWNIIDWQVIENRY
jgi:Fe-Mn family superoxide dismutase